ncbi:hypothetical protein N180_18485 [Pedobacter antarcticus 4BY]|uniref:Uncharacterized protein n=1 Tax=Pedobacter antarcticus 4BY TaxID=1358423 RepID=A0A081PDQ8_9SPHI|nr:hypothetical protein N180_18485 [Pedobacter antarcticus 4BY]
MRVISGKGGDDERGEVIAKKNRLGLFRTTAKLKGSFKPNLFFLCGVTAVFKGGPGVCRRTV